MFEFWKRFVVRKSFSAQNHEYELMHNTLRGRYELLRDGIEIGKKLHVFDSGWTFDAPEVKLTVSMGRWLSFQQFQYHWDEGESPTTPAI